MIYEKLPAFIKKSLKCICFLVLFICKSFTGSAQNKLLYETPPANKARVFFLYDMEHPRTKTIDISSSPVFLNGQMICRLKTRTFTYVDIDTGHHQLAVQWTGKKYKPRQAEKTELEAEPGQTYYYELVEEWSGGFTVNLVLEKRKARELELIIEQKRTILIEAAITTKYKKEDPFINKRFFVRVPVGYNFPVRDYKNWWPADRRPAVQRFQPISPGFEIGVKLGEKNHFLSWGYTNSTQPSVRNPGNTNVREFISLNFNTLYYSYAFGLTANNRFLLYPKAGISSLNYVLERRVDDGSGGTTGVRGFGTNAGLHAEYRLSRMFSIDANWEYLHGKAVLQGEKINLNQHRIFIGLRVQFDITKAITD